MTPILTETIATLSKREREVLRLIGKGLGRKEIAEKLCRSAKTVDAHRCNIMLKLDIHDRTNLALFAVKHAEALV